MPDPEALKDDASPDKQGTQRQQQQQQQGGPGSGRAFQRVKAEEWLNKKARPFAAHIACHAAATLAVEATCLTSILRTLLCP